MGQLSQEEIAQARKNSAMQRHNERQQLQAHRQALHQALQNKIQHVMDDRDLSLRFLHVRRMSQAANSQWDAKGGATIAFAYIGDGRSTKVYYSTAWCNPKDHYCRVLGALNAAKDFADGQFTTFINRSKRLSMEAALHTMFSEVV